MNSRRNPMTTKKKTKTPNPLVPPAPQAIPDLSYELLPRWLRPLGDRVMVQEVPSYFACMRSSLLECL